MSATALRDDEPPEALRDGCAEKRRALVVDDDPTQRLVLCTVLEKIGFEVVEAEDGRQGLERFKASEPHLVLLDILMPELDGFATCRRIRELTYGSRTPIIMITSLDDESSIELAYEAGATDFVVKPINYSLLVHRVRYMLRAHRVLADFDELTGLPARAAFLEFLEVLLALSRRRGTSTALLYLDIDHFRRFNDTLGRWAGDDLLRQIAKRLESALRGADVLARDVASQTPETGSFATNLSVARCGGDEFVLALSDVRSPDDAEAAATRVVNALTREFMVGGEKLYLTASVGISLSPADGTDADSLLRHAEAAKEHAKRKGRNGHQFFTHSLNDRSSRRFSLERVLRNAMDRGLFVMYYQPKLDIGADRFTGMEALIRLDHPDQGLIGPAEFIPVAEDTGLILDLGYWAIEAACDHARACQELVADDLAVAINLSPAQFRDSSLAERFASILQRCGLAPQRVELELTERLLLENTEASMRMLARLREIGVGISVDDFGTGYSSLSYLKRFKANGLKIDGSFIRDIAVDADDARIVSAIINMGHSLGLKVTAEGVENREQLTFLRAYGCDEVQGFLYSPPLSFSELRGWLESGCGNSPAATGAERRVSRSA